LSGLPPWRTEYEQVLRSSNGPPDMGIEDNAAGTIARGVATCGSQYWIQVFVNRPDLRNEIEAEIISHSPSLLAFDPSVIDWKSPLEADRFREYRGSDFLGKLDLHHMREPMSRFWPLNGPMWDAFAIVRNASEEPGVLLVEAKAHVGETIGTCGATSPVIRNRITRTFSRVQRFMGVPDVDWLTNVYHLANRVAFLQFLNDVGNIPTWLVLVNFTNDPTINPLNPVAHLKCLRSFRR
jgi:hypothetical protein